MIVIVDPVSEVYRCQRHRRLPPGHLAWRPPSNSRRLGRMPIL